MCSEHHRAELDARAAGDLAGVARGCSIAPSTESNTRDLSDCVLGCVCVYECVECVCGLVLQKRQRKGGFYKFFRAA